MKRETADLFGTLFLAIALVASGCAKHPERTVMRSGDDPVIGVRTNDAEMNRAMQKAKDSIDEFIKQLPDRKGRFFSIKTPLRDSLGGSEHIWVSVKSYSNGVFSGKLDNDPLNLPGMHLGDPIDVKKEDIDDWVIFDPKTENMTGGFTVKVLMSKEGQNKQ